jgi:hypothetical protein
MKSITGHSLPLLLEVVLVLIDHSLKRLSMMLIQQQLRDYRKLKWVLQQRWVISLWLYMAVAIVQHKQVLQDTQQQV